MSNSSAITEAQIVELENQLRQVVLSADSEGLARLLHDDLLFNTPDGQTATKAMDVEAYRSGNMRVSNFTPSDRQINLIGNCAVVAVTVALRGSNFGQEFKGLFRYLRVWKQIGETWQIIGGSCVALPES